MAWTWSYTNEGIDAIMNAIGREPAVRLCEGLAEQRAAFFDDLGNLEMSEALYQEWYARFQNLPLDIIIDGVREATTEIETCSNGGFETWYCPFGCHTVTLGESTPDVSRMIRITY